MKSEAREIELKPCPFCNCRMFKGKFEVVSIPLDGSGTAFWQYKCPKCRTHFAFGPFTTEQEVFNFWNTRFDAGVAHATQWVRISESGLPDEGTLPSGWAGRYWFQTSAGGVFCGHYFNDDAGNRRWWYNGDVVEPVIAYIPIPEPMPLPPPCEIDGGEK